MKLEETTELYHGDQVTWFSLVSGPQDRELERLLGWLIIEFGRIEYLIKFGIARLQIAVKKQARAPETLTAAFSDAERHFKIKEMLRQLRARYADWEADSDKQRRFCLLCDEIERLYENRNHMIHGCWSTRADREHRLIRSKLQKPRNQLHQFVLKVEEDELEKLCRAANAARVALVVSLDMNEGTVGIQVPVVHGPRPIG